MMNNSRLLCFTIPLFSHFNTIIKQDGVKPADYVMFVQESRPEDQ